VDKFIAASVADVFAVAAQYLYDRSKPHPLYSFGSPHGDVSHAIEEVAEVDEESDGECASAGAELHNSASQTSLIRQKLSPDDNGILSLLNVPCHLIWCFALCHFHHFLGDTMSYSLK